MVTSSGVSILFTLYVYGFRIVLFGLCSTVAMIYDLIPFVFAPLKSFCTTLLEMCNIFEPLMCLTLMSQINQVGW